MMEQAADLPTYGVLTQVAGAFVAMSASLSDAGRAWAARATDLSYAVVIFVFVILIEIVLVALVYEKWSTASGWGLAAAFAFIVALPFFGTWNVWSFVKSGNRKPNKMSDLTRDIMNAIAFFLIAAGGIIQVL